MSSVLKNTAVVAALTCVSRALGLVREMFQSRLIGAGWAASAFALAFAIPNMARRLFGEGALTAAFVPVFKGELAADETQVRAVRLARAVLTMAALMLGAAVILIVIGITGALYWEDLFSERSVLALRLTRILIPYMLFICAGAFGMGVLNAYGKFAAASLMPSVLNLFWIASLAVLCFMPNLSVPDRCKFVSVAILMAGFVQMSFMFRGMYGKGVKPWPSFKGWRDDATRLVWRNMVVAAIGTGAVQINYMLDQVLAQLASNWAAGVLQYSDRLMELPLGVVGTAFGTVLLPTFAGYFASGDVDSAREALSGSLRNMLLVVIPSAVGLIVLAPEITSLVYEGHAFGAHDTVRVYRALACYSTGLVFFCAMKSLTPWFQAQGDMKTPLKVATGMVGANATLNVLSVFLLPVEWRHVGLAGSTVLCSAASCVWLVRLAHGKNGSLGLRTLVKPVAEMCVASFVMAAAIMFGKGIVTKALDGIPMAKLVEMVAFVLIGGIVYCAVVCVFDRQAFGRLLKELKSSSRRGKRAVGARGPVK